MTFTEITCDENLGPFNYNSRSNTNFSAYWTDTSWDTFEPMNAKTLTNTQDSRETLRQVNRRGSGSYEMCRCLYPFQR